MRSTRVTIRHVDQAVIDRVRIHIRQHGLYLGEVVNSALKVYMDSVDRQKATSRPSW